jgi:hypothetical protein
MKNGEWRMEYKVWSPDGVFRTYHTALMTRTSKSTILADDATDYGDFGVAKISLEEEEEAT